MRMCCGFAVFLLSLLHVAQVRAQCTAPTVGENMVLTEASLNQTYDDGANVTFDCLNGFKPGNSKAPKWISCTEGTWSELQLQCKLTCPKPYVGGDRVLTAASLRDIYFDGSSATFQCASGYRSVEPVTGRSIKCIRGNWTELGYKCKKKSCRNPGEIQHGWYDMSAGIEFGATISGKCNKGYQPAGQVNTRTCLGSEWNGRATICEAVKCNNPPSIANGVFQPKLNVYEYGETITYSCNSDSLVLIGNKTIACSEDGTFQSPPKCKGVSCPAVRIVNGYRSGGTFSQSYTYRNFLEFQCAKGYKIKGSSRITCEENGWDPPPPNCEEVTCEAQDVAHGFISGGKASVYRGDDLIEYRCNKGYKLDGSNKLTCTENGWNLEPPVCREVICEAQDVAHALIVGGRAPVYRGDDLIEYRCAEAYKMDGYSKLTCTEGGWNQRFPMCIEVTCKAQDVAHAIIVGGKASVYKQSDYIKYRCDQGYEMVGHEALTCTETGWNPNPPLCKVNCVAHDVAHAVILGRKAPVYREHDLIEYRCDKGYKLDGFNKLTCTENGWNLEPPVCREVTCEAQDVAHALIVGGRASVYRRNDLIEYRCDEAYKMEGYSKLTCTENGWNLEPPVCREVTCETPDVVHAVIVKGKASLYRADDLIEYQCDEGYKMEGSGIQTCTERGWSSSPPVCNESRDHILVIVLCVFFFFLNVLFCCICRWHLNKRKSKQFPKPMSMESESMM